MAVVVPEPTLGAELYGVEELNEELGELRLRYVPHEPTAKQEWFLLRQELEVFFGGAAGPGKALSLDTPIPTPTGWTNMAGIQEGDVVLDRDGQPTLVLAVSEVMRGHDVYRVRFNDGASVVADGGHLWETLTADERAQGARRDPAFRERRRAARPSRATGRRPHVAVLNREREYDVLSPPEPKARTTRELGATVVDRRGRRNHSITLHPGIDLRPRDLPVDPYVLGVWLGDGNTRDGHITTADQEVVDVIRACGHEARRVPSARYGWRVVGLTQLLRPLGVLGCKHVPDPYLRGCKRQRLALLQGLMDSDGHANEGGCEFTSTLPRLADAVAELCRSLGGLASVREERAVLGGRDCGPRWRVHLSLHLPMFRLTRKAARQPIGRVGRSRYVVAVEPVPSVPVRCIRTYAGTYLAGREMIPTHNSWALLMAALQYADVPGYNALILRPELQEFYKPKALIPVSTDWLTGQAAWNGSLRQWTFPSGATLSFGYLRTLTDLAHFKGPAYAFVGFDELTEFSEQLYRGMFRVLRDPPPGVPLRMRSASNPGGPGHGWVKSSLVSLASRKKGAVFVPAKIRDNPYMDYDEYMVSLAHLSPLDRQRLIDGDWDVMEEGDKFAREDFEIIDAPLAGVTKVVRYWDLAATEPSPSNTDPDWTVGLRLEETAAGLFVIARIERFRQSDAEVERRVRQAAVEDGPAVAVFVEQEPGASGKLLIGHWKRKVLHGYPCHAGLPRGGNKEVRARPVAAAAKNGLVKLVRGPHMLEFLDECSIFPNGDHDDCVDALSGAHTALTRGIMGGSSTSVPRHGRVPAGGSTAIRAPSVASGAGGGAAVAGGAVAARVTSVPRRGRMGRPGSPG